MKIVIDARMLSWTGIGRYTRALLEQLQSLDSVNDYVVLKRSADDWTPTADRWRAEVCDIEPYSLGGQIKLSQVLTRLAPDLVHFPHFTVPLAYSGRYVVTLHDFTLLDYRNVRDHPIDRLKYQIKYTAMKAIVGHALGGAARVITDTAWVADEVTRRYPKTAGRVSQVHLAADPIMAAPTSIERFGIDAPYLLYVGNHYPYKNVERLIKAFQILAPDQIGLKLVITGKRDYFRDQLEQVAKVASVHDRVIFTDFVSDGELVSLYRGAALYCFPSLSEGFGLPGLEAMAQGTPVIASGKTCLPEVYGEAAAYFSDPLDPTIMAGEISQLLGDEAELQRLRAAGPRRVREYSWQRTAEQTLAVYRQALKG